MKNIAGWRICGDNAESKIRETSINDTWLCALNEAPRPSRAVNGLAVVIEWCTQSSIITQSGAEAARLAHTQKATGASPVSATNCARLYGSLAHKGVIRWSLARWRIASWVARIQRSRKCAVAPTFVEPFRNYMEVWESGLIRQSWKLKGLRVPWVRISPLPPFRFQFFK